MQLIQYVKLAESKDKLTVHHKMPFHLDKSMELSLDNLCTLCEGKEVNCHFVFGHCFFSWKCYNPNVEQDIKLIDTIRTCAKMEKETETTDL